MAMKEYAHSLGEKLKAKPTKSNIVAAVNDILSVTISGDPITEDQVRIILSCMDDELGDYGAIEKIISEIRIE